jgi:hypothetical protein
VGAALAAMGLRQAADSVLRRYREQARSHGKPGSDDGAGVLFVGATFGRDAASEGRGLRSMLLSRASSLPQDSGAVSDLERFLWERPWPRWGFDRPLTPFYAAIASKLAPTGNQAPTMARACFSWERPLVAMRHLRAGGFDPCCYRERAHSHKTLALSVIRERFFVGAALAAMGLRQAADSVLRRYREQARSHQNPAPTVTWDCFRGSDLWSRWGFDRPPAPVQAAIASKLAPTRPGQRAKTDAICLPPDSGSRASAASAAASPPKSS